MSINDNRFFGCLHAAVQHCKSATKCSGTNDWPKRRSCGKTNPAQGRTFGSTLCSTDTPAPPFKCVELQGLESGNKASGCSSRSTPRSSTRFAPRASRRWTRRRSRHGVRAGEVESGVPLAGRRGTRRNLFPVLRESKDRARRTGARPSVKEIADLLRHQSLDTANTYARVDLEGLWTVALLWPGSRP